MTRSSLCTALCVLSTLALFAPTAAVAEPCAAKGTPQAKSTDPKVCLSCHDGVLAKNVTHTLARSTRTTSFSTMGFSRGASHPVNIAYALTYVRKPRRYNPPSMLDSRIKLNKGEVTCLSCHDLESTEKKALVMSNWRSALCLSCHNL